MQWKLGSAKLWLAANGLGLLFFGNAVGGIVEFGDAAVIAEPPPDISLGLWESTTEIRVWPERQTTLGAALMLDAVNTGIAFPGGIPGEISAFTAVESFMVRNDPVGGDEVMLSGYVIFDQPVLGVIFEKQPMIDTDGFLGRPGVLYNTMNSRGLEGTDTFEISDDRLRVDFFYRTTTATDDVRIITAVPEPGTLALLTMTGFALLRQRIRRNIC